MDEAPASARVLGSDDLVSYILAQGGLGACALFAQCSHSLALSASALVARWSELTPLRTVSPEACDSLLNPSYMLALGDGGLLVSAGCPSGGLVCRLLLFEADAMAAEQVAETTEERKVTVRSEMTRMATTATRRSSTCVRLASPPPVHLATAMMPGLARDSLRRSAARFRQRRPQTLSQDYLWRARRARTCLR